MLLVFWKKKKKIKIKIEVKVPNLMEINGANFWEDLKANAKLINVITCSVQNLGFIKSF